MTHGKEIDTYFKSIPFMTDIQTTIVTGDHETVEESQQSPAQYRTTKASTKAKDNKKGRFRISAKKLFLTYSQIPTEMTEHDAYIPLQQKLDIRNYLIAVEKHKDGGLHIHAVIVLRKKCNITSPKTLDLVFENKPIHGNYAPVKNINQSIAYVCKDTNYITDFKNIKDGKLMSIPEEILHVFEERGERAAMLHYLNSYPDKAFGPKGIVNTQRLFKLVDRLKVEVPSVPETPFKITDFDIPEDLQQWIDQGGQPTLILGGDAGLGKTSLVKTIVLPITFNGRP